MNNPPNTPHKPSLILDTNGQPVNPEGHRPLYLPPGTGEPLAGRIVPLNPEPQDATAHPDIKSCVVVITSRGAWAKAGNLESALAFLHTTGTRGKQLVAIFSYKGPVEALNTIAVDEKGHVRYPVNCLSIPVGTIRVNMASHKPKGAK